MQHVAHRLRLLGRCWKHSLQHNKSMGVKYGRHFTHGKEITFLQIFYSLQAERATRQLRPLLPYATGQLRLPMHRWKRSLQLYCPQVALQKKATFSTAIKLLIAVRYLFSCTDGERATLPCCASIGAYNASL